MKKIFIDGKAGTTGLRIEERLSGRDDIEIVTIPEELRKDPVAKKEILNSVDIAFLCLPDAAAVESVGLIENENVVVIDTSTAHRTNPAWAYGFPELDKSFEEKIKNSKRIAVPGCHASGFIALVYPLVKNGIISPDILLTAHSLTGYSGGGKNMIAQYEDDELEMLLHGPRQYGLTQKHKHLPEMVKITGLKNAPVFCPIVGTFYSGMEVTVPLFKSQLLKGGIEEIKEIYRNTYNNGIVSYVDGDDENGFLSAVKLEGKDSMQIEVYGNEDRILLVARYDNLGKGASGAAVECLNIVLGADKTKTLEI
ncbi:MAG: N-acetyl-gamma-glutamyl-phosphate reductase [Ruminococcaceae bacterium]|nr:N-acetyl-gamma-glutamyl-phosphate reductase [Oscillospiraceae bacterium]